MQVAVYYNNRDVRIEERPRPKIEAGEFLMQVKACGICGSDCLEWYRVKRAPLVLGHEATGDIVEIGKGVKKYKVGDKVFVSHHVPCNTCRYCLDGNQTVCETLHTTNYSPGGFSEYVRVPAINVERGVIVLPKEVSYDEGTFIEPLGCVLRGQRMTGLKKGQSVLILGGGISGLLHLLLARSKGASRIIVTDINDYRLKAARDLGADSVINAQEDLPAQLKEINAGRLADVVIVCTGAVPAFKQALKCAERAGTILFFACPEPGVEIGIPVNDYWRNSIKILHSYGASFSDLTEATELLRAKKIKVEKLITHRLPLSQAALGFKLVSEAKDCIKVILQP